MLDKELLYSFVCPVCMADVVLDGDWIVCSKCNRRYPIRDGIPVMLPEEAVLPESTGPDSAEAQPHAEG